MSQAQNDRRIDYIEFPASDLPSTKRFYEEVFAWRFEDYGPHYTSFRDGRLEGGFTTREKPTAAGPLVVIYAADLAAIESKVAAAGGVIVKPAYSFPGGRRFHFADPSGNVLAVWSE
ncbi:MAG: VOC family protein [Bryobacteraceae bacterium]